MPSLLQIVLGLAALLTGAEILVRGGSGLATWLGIRPMVIGLTVVSLGTSAPELAVGIDAVNNHSSELAVGNIVGTNLVNILFILGLSALLIPVAFERRTLRLDLPVMTAAALLLYVLSLDHTLRPLDGWLLVCGGVAYTWVLLWASRRERAAEGVAEPVTDDGEERRPRPFRSGAELLVGLGIIVVGAELLVDGAVASAESLGVSKAVIGLTVVAIGTSAPELVTTLVSTRRGDRDIAVGNLLGSSIYNIVFVLGVTVIVAPSGVPVPHDVLTTDLILMVVVAVVAIPVFVSGARISRVEGGVFVAAYLGYMTWLLVART